MIPDWGLVANLFFCIFSFLHFSYFFFFLQTEERNVKRKEKNGMFQVSILFCFRFIAAHVG
ncbi:Uncharacterized protein APZ42_016472 [Daphnia magna]|uniref:Uncharacterized protein n=1 Tax=Daphnia magna TaxID=35525 RepID=A0A165AFK4_9CRUS|nr:Uncharacterized protein APZ42_016472 [Daphnia magna]